MRFPLIAVVLTFGCAPPDIPEDTGSSAEQLPPTVRIVYPPSNEPMPLLGLSDVEDAADACKIRTVVAIDVDNFLIKENSDTEVDGEGHWHLQLQDEDYFPVLNQYGDLTSQRTYVPGGLVTISAELVSNTHQSFDPINSTLVEFPIVAPTDGTDCSSL